MDEEDLEVLIASAGEMPTDLEFKDDGYIELVLRILALMCDNQHVGLQVRPVSFKMWLWILIFDNRAWVWHASLLDCPMNLKVMCHHEWMNEWMKERKKKRKEKERKKERKNEWMNEWTDI